MRNTKEQEYYKKELEKENLVLEKHILERRKLIEEQEEILDTQKITINNSFISISNYNKYANKRKEAYDAKTAQINEVEEMIKKSSTKVSDYEVYLGMKKSKDVKKEYTTLCDRLNCEAKIREHSLLETSINDYIQLRENRMMLISKLEKDPNHNNQLLSTIKLEEDNISKQLDMLELTRKEMLETINVLSVERNGLLDRQKQLNKIKR